MSTVLEPAKPVGTAMNEEGTGSGGRPRDEDDRCICYTSLFAVWFYLSFFVRVMAAIAQTALVSSAITAMHLW